MKCRQISFDAQDVVAAAIGECLSHFLPARDCVDSDERALEIDEFQKFENRRHIRALSFGLESPTRLAILGGEDKDLVSHAGLFSALLEGSTVVLPTLGITSSVDDVVDAVSVVGKPARITARVRFLRSDGAYLVFEVDPGQRQSVIGK